MSKGKKKGKTGYLGLPVASYGRKQQAEIERLEKALAKHMKAAKPKRYEHSLSVSRVAEGLALAYGADPFEARAAGILHDWHKVYTQAEQIEMAARAGIDLGVEPTLVANILHGMITACELPERFPELPEAVWQAIARHTTGAVGMSTLDMVVFTADIIEPLRGSNPSIDFTRSMVEKARPLDEIYWSAFTRGVSYVIETGRYLYPGTLDIYNQGVLARKGRA